MRPATVPLHAPHSRSFALVLALVAACTRDANRSASTAAATRTANGTVASPISVADSISERADRGRILGDSTATLWLIMASDFQCPYCKQWHDARFAQLMKNYVAKGRIRLAFINYPLSQHQNALPAAEAGMCAAVQDKFWPMHEALFATQPKWETLRNPTPMFDSLATAAGVNMAAYSACVSKHLTLPLIEADHDRGRRLASSRRRRSSSAIRCCRVPMRISPARSTPRFGRGQKVELNAGEVSGPARISRARADCARRSGRRTE